MRAMALTALLLAPPGGAAADADPLAAETVEVADLAGPLAADPGAPGWDGLPALEVEVGPQRSVSLHDARANAALAASAPRSVRVRAATDGKDLAVVVDWADPGEDRSRDETDAHADGVALQLPQRFGPGQRLPYVGMGDPEQPVVLYLARAALGGVSVRQAVAAGFGSTTRADLGDARVAMRWKDGSWRAVFVRPLATAANDLGRGLVPFAVAVWDGARAERGGNKALSAWKLLRVSRLPADPTYADELAWGRRADERGDPARGKQLVNGLCVACHLTPERKVARPGLAPDLSGIGVYATPAYLRDSIVAPSAVIVPSPNADQHQDRTAPAPPGQAFRRAEAFVWYRKDPAGRPVSRMPPYASLPSSDVNAMVAYLMTLGRTP
jgi:complex iron-sulfur molybdoenzyme family reductase subunit gamma